MTNDLNFDLTLYYYLSASLLPPAVNSGILFAAWALQGTGLIGNPDTVYPHRSPGIGAAISFLLTIINILCIYFSACLMFELKKVRGARCVRESFALHSANLYSNTLTRLLLQLILEE